MFIAAARLEVCIGSLCWFICIHSSVGAGNVGDAAALLRKLFGAGLIRFRQVWLDLGGIRAKLSSRSDKIGRGWGEVWAWVIGFGRDQGLTYQKHSISYGYVHSYTINAWPDDWWSWTLFTVIASNAYCNYLSNCYTV